MTIIDKKNYIIIKDIAEMFKEGFSIKQIQTKLQSKIPKYREKFQNTGQNNDLECKIAAEIAKNKNIEDSVVINYIDEKTRKHIQNEKMKNTKFKGDINPKDGRPFDGNSKKDIKKKLTSPIGQGTCGKCWMCGQPVYFYYDKKFVTNCGDCEHIGGIVAALLAGMLLSTMSSESHYNYGTSHVHCNRKKSEMISMRFDNEENKWEYDEDGTDAIVKAICSETVHESENDPEFVEKFHLLKKSKTIVKENIEDYTNDVWCPAANDIIKRFVKDDIFDISKRTLTIIMWINSSNNEFEQLKNEQKKKITQTVDSDDDNDDDNYDYYGGEPSPEKKASPKKYTYRPEETFGIKIINEAHAQEILNELKTKPEFKELLNNLIIAIDEKLDMRSPSPKKMSTSPKKTSPKKMSTSPKKASPKKMSTIPKKASPSQNYSIKSIKDVNNLFLQRETQNLFTQFLPVNEVEIISKSLKRSRSPSNNNNQYTNKRIKAGRKITKKSKTRKYRRKRLS
jgi:hypothetical protein